MVKHWVSVHPGTAKPVFNQFIVGKYKSALSRQVPIWRNVLNSVGLNCCGLSKTPIIVTCYKHKYLNVKLPFLKLCQSKVTNKRAFYFSTSHLWSQKVETLFKILRIKCFEHASFFQIPSCQQCFRTKVLFLIIAIKY